MTYDPSWLFDGWLLYVGYHAELKMPDVQQVLHCDWLTRLINWQVLNIQQSF